MFLLATTVASCGGQDNPVMFSSDTPIVGTASVSGLPAMNCSSPLVPANGGEGGVTDFSEYNPTTHEWWGDLNGLHGGTFAYEGGNSTVKASVDTTAANLHVVGKAAVVAGAGLSFFVCATVQSFTQVSFALAGSAPGCNLALAIQTYDEIPTNIGFEPAGQCHSSTTTCNVFPTVERLAEPSAAPAIITTPLASFSNWSAANAAQVVGLRWQFQPSGAAGCAFDITLDDVKFLP